MLHRSRRPASPARGRAPRGITASVGLAVAAVTLTGTLGSGTAATWSSSAALGSPVITAGTATAELAGFSDLTHTFARNGLIQAAAVRLGNSGDVAADFTTTVTLGAGSSSTLASMVEVTVWPLAAKGQCTRTTTPPSTAWEVRWNSAPSLSGRLEPGATVAYCIRTEIQRWQLPSAAMSMTATLSATLAVPGTGWRSTATESATQSVARSVRR
jgi:hypothetical protein